MTHAPRKLSSILKDLKADLKDDRVTLGFLLEAFHERGFGFLLLIFAFPMALPLPVPPGINVLLALPLLVLTAQQAIGRHTIWMPHSMRDKGFSRQSFSDLIETCLPWLERIEKLSKPRIGFMTRGAASHLIGICGLIMALTVCIPVPLTNTVPSLGIALMALGVIMRDGLAVLAGLAIGMGWVILLAGAVVFLGAEGIDLIKDTIKSFL